MFSSEFSTCYTTSGDIGHKEHPEFGLKNKKVTVDDCDCDVYIQQL